MRYINYLEYLNLKNKNSLLLKYKVFKNNKFFLKEKLSKELVINNIKLDLYQKKSIFIHEVNMLILAGAGSGKTLTILGKIDYLINELHIKPEEILCISYTNKTVLELKNKIKHNIDIFTFHKLALEIIKDYNYYSLESSDYLSYIIDEVFLSICNNIDLSLLKSINKEITSFINVFKVNEYKIEYLDRLIKKNKDLVLKVIKKIFCLYEEELFSTRSIDLNDSISIATSLIRSKGLKRYYKCIIIDEFQDISVSRCNLIAEIKNACNSYLFAVGDDYQSIYKFTGSKLDLIINFKKYFEHPKIIRLNKVYRNSNELIKTASSFIMKNKNQLRKNMSSDKSIKKPIKIIYYKKNMGIKLKKILEQGNFLILGRNTYDINYVLDDDIKLDNNKVLYKNKEYVYMTMHKSKGLESDNVIILNLSNYSFPSIERKSVTNLLLKKDKYKYEEERRLFYVALTRTKNYVYLLVDKDNASIFVKELLLRSRKYIEILDI